MRKVLLTLAVVATCAAANAQPRMVLYEEFTGENCAPCAAANPGLWALMTSGSNPSAIQMIKYMAPLPSAGPFYDQAKALADARISYYGDSTVPYGRMDGAVPDLSAGQDAGQPTYLTQTDIDTEAAVRSPFKMTISAVYNATHDSVIATIHITDSSAYAPGGNSVYLRTALVETVNWATPPGTNGETDFENVVRAMYPDATGTGIAASWAVGATQTITIKGAIPSYVDKAGAPYIVAWIQNDSDKSIAQAAKSDPLPGVPLDVASQSIAVPAQLLCDSGSASIMPTVTLHNAGTSTLASAAIFYKTDNGAWQHTTWTGSLAAGDSTTQALPALTLSAGSSYVIYDSVALPNAAADENNLNNTSFTIVTIQSSVADTLAQATDFNNGGTLPTNWSFYDENANLENWQLVQINGTYSAIHSNYEFAAGERNYILMPAFKRASAHTYSLYFQEAYAQYQAENDELEVVYSIDCGQSWTTLWSEAGSALSTAPATTSPFIPTAGQWMPVNVDLTSIPRDSQTILAFRATSDFGNNLYIDSVSIPKGIPSTGVNSVTAIAGARIYPNPASSQATLSFYLGSTAHVQVQVMDAVGRIASTVMDATLQAGAQKIAINTSNLASGIYNVMVRTDKGAMTQRLSVVR